MSDTWPAGLPCPVLSGYGFDVDDGVEDYGTEDGGLIQRQRYCHRPTVHTFTIVMTRADSATYAAFKSRMAAKTFEVSIQTPFNIDKTRQTFLARFIGRSSDTYERHSPSTYSVPVTLYLIATKDRLEDECEIVYQSFYDDCYEAFACGLSDFMMAIPVNQHIPAP